MTTRTLGIPIALCCLTLAACAPDQTLGSVFVTSSTVEASTGGSVVVTEADSPLFAGTRIDIPAGSLSADTEITIAPGFGAISDTSVGLIVDFGPDGTLFDPPATVVLPHDGDVPIRIGVREADGTLAIIDEVETDASAALVRFAVSGFTEFQPELIPCSADADCPDYGRCLEGLCDSALCADDAECPMGELCLDGACAQLCVMSADCPPDQWCDQGMCVDGQGGCTNDAECAIGEVCDLVTALCVASTVCASDSDCAPGQACAGGACIELPCLEDPGCACATDGDCPSDWLCVRGLCLDYGCSDDSECGPGATCVAGECTVDTNPDPCAAIADCDPGELCVGGTCLPICNDDADCASGLICETGLCIADTNPPACSEDADCGFGFYCLGGVCAEQPDPCGGACGAGEVCLDGSCTAICASDSDCMTGGYCNGSICMCPYGSFIDTDGSCQQNECAVDGDCPERMVCGQGVCEILCFDDSECASGLSCLDSYCQ